MRNKVLVILLTISMAISMAACNSKTSEITTGNVENEGAKESEVVKDTKSEEAKESEAVKDTKSEEDFKKQYALIIAAIDVLNVNSDFVGATHATIWDNVGVKDVATYVKYVREYYNDESRDVLICKAYGVSAYGTEKEKVYDYAEQYVNSLAEIDTKMVEIDEMYKTINSTYGNDYNISDLKEYYLESSAYAEFAKELDGSYITYCQTLNDYQDNLTKLKKAAEIAY